MEEYYSIKNNPSKDRYDRYRNCSMLLDVATKDQLLSSREIKTIPISVKDIYHTVKSNEVGRLDIIAHIYYSNPILWWLIAQANDIYDPFEGVVVGSVLRIPSLETLYGNNGILL